MANKMNIHILSDRELEVLLSVCDELTNKEIAEKLYLSKRTIESHRRNIMDKVGAKTVVGLVRYAYDMDYLEPKIKI